MQYKNGIPVDIPHKRQRLLTGIKRSNGKRTHVHSDYDKYNTFATMYKPSERVWAMVPVAHPDFKELKKQGFKKIEVWKKPVP